MQAATSIPVALTLAGSDNCGGAGAQADLKTFHAHRVHGLSALTAVVSEVPGKVERLFPLPPALVESQLRLLFETYPVGAWKTGMLHSAEIVALAAAFQSVPMAPPLVVDPVLVASSGDPLVESATVHAYKSQLFPLATLVTPNLQEAETLLGIRVSTLDDLMLAGVRLATSNGVPFLMKGGHLHGDLAVDLLIGADASLLARLEAPFEKDADPHGTGCTYSAAITAGLANGQNLVDACLNAKKFITRAIRERLAWDFQERRVEALNLFPPG